MTGPRALAILLLASAAACADPDTAPRNPAPGAPQPAQAATAPDTLAAPGTPDNANPDALTPDGWRNLRIGMTRAEVVAAAGADANPDAVGGPDPASCDEFRPSSAPEGVLVMIRNGQLSRISVSRNRDIRTARGFGVGDTITAISAAYGTAATVTPHTFIADPAAYVTIWTQAPPADATAAAPDARGLVYEIGADGRVMHVRAGDESIRYVEGCV